MTWYYDVADDGSMDVYDHTATLIKTVQNDGNGFQIPNDIYEVMISETVSRGLQNTSEWQTQTIVDIAAGNIQKGAPQT